MKGKIILGILICSIISCAQTMQIIDKKVVLKLKKVPYTTNGDLGLYEIYYEIIQELGGRIVSFALDRQGNIYIANYFDSRIQVYDTTGECIKIIELEEFTKMKERVLELGYVGAEGRPRHIIVDNNAKIYLTYLLVNYKEEPPKTDYFLGRYSSDGSFEKFIKCGGAGYTFITLDNSIIQSYFGEYEILEENAEEIKTVSVPDSMIRFFPSNDDSIQIFFPRSFEKVKIKSPGRSETFNLPNELAINKFNVSHPIFIYPDEMHIYEIEDTTGAEDYDNDPYFRIVRYRLKIE